MSETVEVGSAKHKKRVLKYPDGLKQILRLQSSGTPSTGGSNRYKNPITLVGREGVGEVRTE